MKAEQFLKQCADVLIERGKEYDKPEGERSMGKTVAAFEAITGVRISEAEGWLFMQILKDVRQWQNPSRYHEDSAVDGVSYSALKAEALSNCAPVVSAADSDGWIQWSGGECPVSDDDGLIEVALRDGTEHTGEDGAEIGSYWNWNNIFGNSNIIAYRIHKEAI